MRRRGDGIGPRLAASAPSKANGVKRAGLLRHRFNLSDNPRVWVSSGHWSRRRVDAMDVTVRAVPVRCHKGTPCRRMLYEEVLPRAVQPVRSDAIGEPEQGAVGVGVPPDA